MKVAGVSINVNRLPSKELLIRLAQKTGLYNRPDGMFLIEKEIEESGLYKSNDKKRRSTGKANAKVSSRSRNNKQSNNNKRSKA